MDTVVFKDSTVIDYFTTEVILAKVDAEKEDSAVAQHYRVSGYPTLVLVNGNGDEIDRIIGYMEAPDFLAKVNDYLNGIGTLDALLAQADTVADRQLFYDIAEKYKYRGGDVEAKMWYAKVIEIGQPNDSLSGESRMAIADMIRRGKDYAAAEMEFSSIMNDFKGSVFAQDAEVWRAIVFRQQADTAKAIAAFEDFIKHYPESGDVEYATTQIKKLKGEVEPQ